MPHHLMGSQLALENNKMVQHIAVIGAGVVGLSSALSIQKNVPNVKVTVIAEKFDEGTTSWGAGGLFRLAIGTFPEEHLDLVRQWGKDSWNFYTKLAQCELACETGMAMSHGTVISQTPQASSYSLMEELTHDFQEMSEAQLRKMNIPEPFKYGNSFTTVLTHVPTYLRWLMLQFRACGGNVICRKVESLSELSNDFDIVVNCCGIAAKELCHDESVYSVVGHLIRVKAPWIKTFLFSNNGCYIFPHTDYVVIGFMREKDNWSLVADPKTRQATLEKAYALFPSLKKAPIIGEWVGLRPGRPVVRLEIEMLSRGKGKPLPVVHNYGHEGHGISLSWGCGVHATKLVQDIISGSSAKL